MRKPLDISVVIPLLNEEESLSELYGRLSNTMQSTGFSYEIIFVDDGSTDGSAKVIEGLAQNDPKVILISLKRNFGKSNALMVGFNHARGDRAVTLDADLQDIPENIPHLLEQTDYDLVSGWRKNRKDTPFKKLLSLTFNKLVNTIFKVDCKDLNCGFKVYKRELYQTLSLYGDLHRMTPVLASMEGFSFIEVPIEHAKRKYGYSKYPLFRARGLWDILSISVMKSLQTRPFHFFAPYSIVLLILSGVLFLALASGAWESSLANTLLIIFVVLGIYFFVVGLQFEAQLNVFQKNLPFQDTVKRVIGGKQDS